MIPWIKKIAAFVANHCRYWYNRSRATLNRFRKSQHQLTSTTQFDRYPELFGEVKKNVRVEPGRILSFGCSTGEECFTLRRYFPSATIVGVDISSSNLRKANEKNSDHAIVFLPSTSENISKNGKYDLIFCLSVLCRWEDTKDIDNCGAIYPFHKFEDTVMMLSANLKSGGTMVIYNSNFRFEETKIAEKFRIVETPHVSNSGFVHKFDRNNNRVYDKHTHCVYQKL